MDEPTELPEGAVVDDEADDLDDAERAALDRAISPASESLRAGLGRPADEVLRELRTGP